MSLYQLHGLRIDSPFPLAAAAARSGPVDLRVRVKSWEEAAPIPADPIVDLVLDGRRRHAAWRQGQALVVTVPGVARFLVEGREVVMRAEGGRDGLARVLLEGFVLALVLQERGSLVLHASAVEVDGMVVAFAGASNAGKSTLAAACCAAGALLVTDDVLRLDVDREPLVHRGADRLRLRPGAAWVLPAFPHVPETGSAADGRSWLRPEAATREVAPLSTLMIPRIVPSGSAPRLRRLAGSSALLALEGSPRILGWRDPVVQARRFAATARLLDRVPVFSLEVPWTGEAADDLPEALVTVIRRMT